MKNTNIIGLIEEKTPGLRIESQDGKTVYTYPCKADGIYGLGERYCSVNHKGKTLVSKVFEKFTRQGEHTYFPLPFYHTSDGHGVFVDTPCEVEFSFFQDNIRIKIDSDAPHNLYFYYGSPGQIVSEFITATGKPLLPPKWAFGVWASANRWNKQSDIEEQLELIEKHNYPVSVIVIEAWSDEATFYIWNGAEYRPCEGEESLSLKDFQFKEPWPDPMGMIRKIHDKGMKLVLWQVPAIKLLEEGRSVKQHQNDWDYADEKELAVKGEDDKPYLIPRQWFIGSMVPDFSNPEAVKWWISKRKYLIEEMKIDGFKTDGGEFIHDDFVKFFAGYDGRQGRNLYPALYQQAYSRLTGESGILFSRAGYLGAQTTPMYWAGDQVSDFSELKSVLNAGISLSLSGIPFWSFDIGGFAGPLPDKELYLRATALGAFVPAMQWHSEPADGQFEEIMKGNGGTNDRSPWNMAKVYDDPDIMEIAKFFANLHMKFLPYFYEEAKKAVEKGLPFMRHLMFDYGEEEAARLCDDEYMVGDILIAPIVSPGNRRMVYLPKGVWFDFWSGERIEGMVTIEKEAELSSIPLYIRESAVALLSLKE